MRNPNEVRRAYSELTDGRNFDLDLQAVSLKHGTFFTDADEVCSSGTAEAEKVLQDMLSFQAVRPKWMPNKNAIAKQIAESMYNTRIDTKRRRPFKDSGMLLDQGRALEILSQYGQLAGNPLAHLFGRKEEYLSLIVTASPVGLYKKNGDGKFLHSDTLLAGFDVTDRYKRVQVEAYSPTAWGILRKRSLTDEMVSELKPIVESYLKKLTDKANEKQ